MVFSEWKAVDLLLSATICCNMLAGLRAHNISLRSLVALGAQRTVMNAKTNALQP